jgi:SAM-dependent methyltransferase
MRVDVLAMQRFYASGLGRMACRMVSARLSALWPQAEGLDVLGLGYPTPYLSLWRTQARRTVAMMPAGQGAEHWPARAPGLVALGEETRLPFLDSVFDRVLLVHALEEAENARLMLREVWRVMAPEGRLCVVAANRLGLWARADHTPFGHGRPYSRGQLGELLRGAMFEPTASARALHAPPLECGLVTGLADGAERTGGFVGSPFAGLVLMEAVKRLYAGSGGEGRGVLLAHAPARPEAARRDRRGAHDQAPFDRG